MSLTHFDARGQAHMVDIGGKEASHRIAVAAGSIAMQPQTLTLIQNSATKKGDVLAVARLAAIMATKKTSDLIPLCHLVPLSHVTVDFTLQQNAVLCVVRCETTGATGVEMEALTGVNIALLTIYDMCKATDRGMIIRDVRLLQKHGGKSGSFSAPMDAAPAI